MASLTVLVIDAFAPPSMHGHPTPHLQDDDIKLVGINQARRRTAIAWITWSPNIPFVERQGRNIIERPTQGVVLHSRDRVIGIDAGYADTRKIHEKRP